MSLAQSYRPSTAGGFDGDYSFLPNLPHFRAQRPRTAAKHSFFESIDGVSLCKEHGVIDTSSYNPDEGASIALQDTSRPKAQKDFGVILTYFAYFEEYPESLRADQRQIRHVRIFFFLEDSTIKVVEKTQVNSGTTQGTQVRRNIILKPDGIPFHFTDFVFGGVATIQRRDYVIINCDNSTRRYLLELGYSPEELQPRTSPEDAYQKYRKSIQADVPQANDNSDWARFHSKKNETKTFSDAMMGVLVDNSGREGFNRYGRLTLNFKCVWDNTPNLYGDRLFFVLKYHMSDNTIEILSVPSAETDGKKKLLRRAKLPVDYGKSMILGERPKPHEFYRWTDLYIGLKLEVYSRELTLVDADAATREFYSSQGGGMQLSGPIIDEIKTIVTPKREIPPPTGFGSEEDSLRSVNGSLMPGGVTLKKLGENKTLAFFASLVSGGADDGNRRFTVQYYVQDNTIKIVEPPVRNSGFSGGVFLSRREVKKENGETLKASDLYVGCKLQVLKHRFLLLDASASTLKWMEQSVHGDIPFPRSNYYCVLDKIRPALLAATENGTLANAFKQATIQAGDDIPEGHATAATLRKVLGKFQLLGDNPADVSEHEVRTIVRGAGNVRQTFEYRKLLEQIVQPTDEFK